MHIFIYIVFIIIGFFAIVRANSGQWKDSKTWNYNEHSGKWEEATTQSQTFLNKGNNEIIVPGMKEKE